MFFKRLVLLLLSLIVALCCFGCSNNDTFTSNGKTIHTRFKAQSNSNSEKYKIADSFKTTDGKYYYLYDIGFVEAMPISLDESNGIYYSGGNTSISFTMVKGTEDTINKTVTSLCSNSVTVKNTASISGELGSKYAKVKAAIETQCINEISQSFESSVSQASTASSEFSQTLEHTFEDGKDPIGFYCYTSLASVQIYELVVYNPETEEIESTVPYAIVGKSFPGLIFSETSFFDCMDDTIDFDVKKIKKFPQPDKVLSNKVTIDFDLNGGSGDINSKEYKLGNTYGELPVPQKLGYNFNYWTLDGKKINADDFVSVSGTLVADWSLKTSRTYTCKKMSAQNAFGTSQGMDTTTIDIPLHEYFDLSALKKEGYQIKFTIKYSVKIGLTNIGELKYKFWLTTGGNTIYTYNDKISNKTDRALYSDPMTTYEGVVVMNLYTDNIQPVEMTNMEILVEFVKP